MAITYQDRTRTRSRTVLLEYSPCPFPRGRHSLNIPFEYTSTLEKPEICPFSPAALVHGFCQAFTATGRDHGYFGQRCTVRSGYGTCSISSLIASPYSVLNYPGWGLYLRSRRSYGTTWVISTGCP